MIYDICVRCWKINKTYQMNGRCIPVLAEEV